VERRLLRRLSELSQLYLVDAHGVVDIPLTQEELAELAGTSRATVNAVLGDAQTRGLVELRRGKVRIVDQGGLAARAGR
jgi:CRP-like cAMP-binding protein